MYQQRRIGWTWVLGVLVVLYNPVLPIHLGSRFWWTVANLVSLVLLYGAALDLQGRKLVETLRKR